MTAFQVGAVAEYDPQEPDFSNLFAFPPHMGRPYGFPGQAYVSIVGEGIRLETGKSSTFDVAKARELGYLLIKAAERHDDLIKQVALIDEQRQNLHTKQESLIQELMR